MEIKDIQVMDESNIYPSTKVYHTREQWELSKRETAVDWHEEL